MNSANILPAVMGLLLGFGVVGLVAYFWDRKHATLEADQTRLMISVGSVRDALYKETDIYKSTIKRLMGLAAGAVAAIEGLQRKVSDEVTALHERISAVVDRAHLDNTQLAQRIDKTEGSVENINKELISFWQRLLSGTLEQGEKVLAEARDRINFLEASAVNMARQTDHLKRRLSDVEQRLQELERVGVPTITKPKTKTISVS